MSSYLLYEASTGVIKVIGTCAPALLSLQSYDGLSMLEITREQAEAVRANRAAWHVVAGVLTAA